MGKRKKQRVAKENLDLQESPGLVKIEAEDFSEEELSWQAPNPPAQKNIPFSLSISLKILLLYAFLGLVLNLVLSERALLLLPVSKNVMQFLVWHKIEIIFILLAPGIFYYSRYLTQKLTSNYENVEQHERSITRINTLLKAINDVNRIILRERSQEKLLQETCLILQQSSNYAMVWAGLCDKDSTLPKLMSSHGDDKQYVQSLLESYSVAGAMERQEPAMAVLRKKQAVIINDVVRFSKDQQSWQKRALSYHYHSIAAFALHTNAGLHGVFAIYANQADMFSQEEVTLLKTLATDLNLGLSEIEQKENLFYLANFDVTTNLPNEALFVDRLQQTIARSNHDDRHIAIAVVQPVMETKYLQIEPGVREKILKETAEHIKKLVRDGDTVGFVGKNEIGVLLNDIATQADVPAIMDKLLSAFQVQYQMKEMQITLHAGVALYPQDASNSSHLIKQAFDALNDIKNSPDSNCKFYSNEMTIELRNIQRIKKEITLALEREEFVLYYQPIVDTQTKNIVGLEVLTRWPNQKLGEVSPSQFFAVADETGLVIPLGNWALKTACKQFVEWQNKGFKDLFICFNISIKQLLEPTFIEQLKEMTKDIKQSADTPTICFEVKEQDFIHYHDMIKESLAQLRSLGINIFLDDFTKEPVLLGEIHQLEVDALKIDAKTVKAIDKNKNTEKMMKGIFAYASSLNIKTIAEGVETQSQYNFLKQVGCDYAQGYCFSSPLLAKNVEALLLNPLE